MRRCMQERRQSWGVNRCFGVNSFNSRKWIPWGALTLESGTGMCHCHGLFFFQAGRRSLAYKFTINAPLMCPHLQFLEKFCIFSLVLAKISALKTQIVPKTPYFPRKFRSLDPTFGNPPKKSWLSPPTSPTPRGIAWMHSGMQILQTTLSKSLYNFMKRFRIADHFDPVIIQCYKGSILKACNIWKEMWNFADNFDYDHTIIKVVGKILHFFWSLIRFTFANFCQIFTHLKVNLTLRQRIIQNGTANPSPPQKKK